MTRFRAGIATLVFVTSFGGQAGAWAKWRPLSSVSPVEKSEEPTRETTLQAAIKGKLSGLSLESPESRKEIESQARAYIAYRRSKPRSTQRQDWPTQCQNDLKGEKNVFCAMSPEGRALLASDPSGEAIERSPLPTAEVAEAFSRADLKTLSEASERGLARALRTFPSWEPLQKVAQAALKSGDCTAPTVLTALGQKSEEFFPSEQFRVMSKALYAKAVQCEGTELAEKARYRLSLLYIWDKRYADAEPHLIALSDRKQGEYNSRALYWRAYCAQEQGNKLLAQAVRGRLINEFPLSYHGLLLNSKTRRVSLGPILEAKDPLVKFRSEKSVVANRWILAAETLMSLGAHDLAADALDQGEQAILQAEVPVRLYAAILEGRTGDNIGQFRALSSIFKDDPQTLTRGTLQLFYPLRQFETLKQHGRRVDPFLVAALIRQESGFNVNARSPAGAMGLMQLMPATARRMERISRRELFDAKTNIRLGVRFFYGLLDRYQMDAELALAAYNAGPERVDEWKRRYPADERQLFFDLIPFKETRDYVALISRNYFWYLNLYSNPGSSVAISKPARAVASLNGNSNNNHLVFTLFHRE